MEESEEEKKRRENAALDRKIAGKELEIASEICEGAFFHLEGGLTPFIDEGVWPWEVAGAADGSDAHGSATQAAEVERAARWRPRCDRVCQSRTVGGYDRSKKKRAERRVVAVVTAVFWTIGYEMKPRPLGDWLG